MEKPCILRGYGHEPVSLLVSVFLAEKEQMWRLKSLKLGLQPLIPQQSHDFGSRNASIVSCMSYMLSLGVCTSTETAPVSKVIDDLDYEIFLVMKKQSTARSCTVMILNCFLLLPCRSDSSNLPLSIMRNESKRIWHIPISALKCSHRYLRWFKLSFWGIWNISNSFVFHEANIFSMKLSNRNICTVEQTISQSSTHWDLTLKGFYWFSWMIFVVTGLSITSLCGCVTSLIT